MPGVVALHDNALVVIGQRPTGGDVCVRNLATGVSESVPVSTLRGRQVERLSDLLDTHEDCLRDVSAAELARAKMRDGVIQGLIVSTGRMGHRLAAAAVKLGASPR